MKMWSKRKKSRLAEMEILKLDMEAKYRSRTRYKNMFRAMFRLMEKVTTISVTGNELAHGHFNGLMRDLGEPFRAKSSLFLTKYRARKPGNVARRLPNIVVLNVLDVNPAELVSYQKQIVHFTIFILGNEDYYKQYKDVIKANMSELIDLTIITNSKENFKYFFGVYHNFVIGKAKKLTFFKVGLVSKSNDRDIIFYRKNPYQRQLFIQDIMGVDELADMCFFHLKSLVIHIFINKPGDVFKLKEILEGQPKGPDMLKVKLQPNAAIWQCVLEQLNTVIRRVRHFSLTESNDGSMIYKCPDKDTHEDTSLVNIKGGRQFPSFLMDSKIDIVLKVPSKNHLNDYCDDVARLKNVATLELHDTGDLLAMVLAKVRKGSWAGLEKVSARVRVEQEKIVMKVADVRKFPKMKMIEFKVDNRQSKKSVMDWFKNNPYNWKHEQTEQKNAVRFVR